jgi:nitroimidazol reductase NimA-like FMN-containing flavoprotein (pyridoxamine 5'-phosphate oxidase superfamily)
LLGTLTPTQIDHLLHTEVIGRIGCHADGSTYVVPITFAYEDGCVYGHSGVGRKIEVMRKNPEVCFEVEHVDTLANWQSVVADGTFEELHGTDAAHGMKVLVDRLMPLMAAEANVPTHGAPAGTHRADTKGVEAVIYRIHLHNPAGRYEAR